MLFYKNNKNCHCKGCCPICNNEIEGFEYFKHYHQSCSCFYNDNKTDKATINVDSELKSEIEMILKDIPNLDEKEQAEIDQIRDLVIKKLY